MIRAYTFLSNHLNVGVDATEKPIRIGEARVKYKTSCVLAPFDHNGQRHITTLDSRNFDTDQEAEQFGKTLHAAGVIVAYRVAYSPKETPTEQDWYLGQQVVYMPDTIHNDSAITRLDSGSC